MPALGLKPSALAVNLPDMKFVIHFMYVRAPGIPISAAAITVLAK